MGPALYVTHRCVQRLHAGPAPRPLAAWSSSRLADRLSSFRRAGVQVTLKLLRDGPQGARAVMLAIRIRPRDAVRCFL